VKGHDVSGDSKIIALIPEIMNIHEVYQRVGRSFRLKRMQRFERDFDITDQTRILDVGGTLYNWQFVRASPRITIVNLHQGPPSIPDNVVWLQADATSLPFEDQSFDICYSNSVIEHLYSSAMQRSMADEIRRVSARYYVQTPNRYFPMEPHYLTPFVHWAPRAIRPVVGKYFTLWSWITRPSFQYCKELAEEIKLLSPSELQTLFPEADIWKERAVGLTKSIAAVKK
jgi:hypothetical protein